MAFQAHVESLLSKCQYHPYTRSYLAQEVQYVISCYPSLQVELTDLVLYNQARELLCLNGTIPVRFKGSIYNTPVRIIYPDLYPSITPIARVIPTANMYVKPSEYVEEDGTVKLNRLQSCNYTYTTIQLIDQLIAAFSTRMPVFQRSLEGPAQPAPFRKIAQPPRRQQVREDQERDLCVICCEYEINTVLLECGHRCMCTRCAKKFKNCPVCRQPVVRFVTTYNA